MQASRWLQCQVLMSGDEMEALFNHLPPFHIIRVGTVTTPGEGEVSCQQFLNAYRLYIDPLTRSEESLFSPYFSSAFTTSLDCLYAVSLPNGQQILRAAIPVIQLQPHRIGWSEADRKFRPLAMGVGSISWGVQFSYPQLYCEVKTQQVVKVDKSDRFPNTLLFHALQRWIRHHTIPTPFSVEGGKVNVPMRLGKECREWINRHPQLIHKGIKVRV